MPNGHDPQQDAELIRRAKAAAAQWEAMSQSLTAENERLRKKIATLERVILVLIDALGEQIGKENI